MFNDAPHCTNCTIVTDATWIDPVFSLAQRNADLSTTFDGCLIASERFVRLTKSEPGVEYIALESEPDFFVMRIHQTVPYQATTITDRCSTCGRFGAVLGPHRKPGIPVPQGFSRSDLDFGDVQCFGTDPVHLDGELLVDLDLGRRLQSAGVRRLHLSEISD